LNLKDVRNMLVNQGFDISAEDNSRPWGAFFVINEDQSQSFADLYFDGVNAESLRIHGKLSPKILVIKPSARLSWQYHNRRAEIWQVFHGTVGVIRSNDDVEGDLVQILRRGTDKTSAR
jgi:mannose-6-phosphate isomerase